VTTPGLLLAARLTQAEDPPCAASLVNVMTFHSLHQTSFFLQPMWMQLPGCRRSLYVMQCQHQASCNKQQHRNQVVMHGGPLSQR
jgi:hypothetical protein